MKKVCWKVTKFQTKIWKKSLKITEIWVKYKLKLGKNWQKCKKYVENWSIITKKIFKSEWNLTKNHRMGQKTCKVGENQVKTEQKYEKKLRNNTKVRL